MSPTMKSLPMLSIVVVVLYFSLLSNGIFLFSISSGPFLCTIKDSEIFLANLPWRKLRPDEVKEGEAYMARLKECQKKNDISTNCTRPPKFCGGNNIKMYLFAGCIVLDNKLYRNQKFVRDLTASDKAQLDKFNKDLAEFNKEVAEEPTPTGPHIVNIRGIPPPGAPRPPVIPAFCRQ